MWTWFRLLERASGKLVFICLLIHSPTHSRAPSPNRNLLNSAKHHIKHRIGQGLFFLIIMKNVTLAHL